MWQQIGLRRSTECLQLKIAAERYDELNASVFSTHPFRRPFFKRLPSRFRKLLVLGEAHPSLLIPTPGGPTEVRFQQVPWSF